MIKKTYIVGNKAKNQISKRVLQETKARHISRKTNILYPLIRACVYQGVRDVRFSENLACFVFLKHLLSDSPFCLITDDITSKRNYFHGLNYIFKKSPLWKKPSASKNYTDLGLYNYRS